MGKNRDTKKARLSVLLTAHGKMKLKVYFGAKIFEIPELSEDPHMRGFQIGFHQNKNIF